MSLLLLLAFAGGVLTILSPCILPVIPLVFARTGRSFARETAPMLAGLALAFTGAALIATTTARWLLVANEAGRHAALALLALVGVTLLSTRAAELVTRPMTRVGAALAGGPASAALSPARHVVIGVAIGLLWAPCAGPILGVLIASAAVSSAPRAGALFLTFALGAAMSLAVLITLGTRLRGRLRTAGTAERVVRRITGAATIATVALLLLGWDRSLLAAAKGADTIAVEDRLVRRLAPGAVPATSASKSLDEFVAEEAAANAPIGIAVQDGPLPGFDGATEWINSPALTPASLRGKVVLVDFWTFGCYNCLNALPHVKALYAKYKDRGFVVVGVHTPEFASERILSSVHSEVRRLGIEYPVVVDNDSRIWRAYRNGFWPAAYYADATGRLRFHHFGEGRYEDQDRVVAKLLAERDAAAGARPAR